MGLDTAPEQMFLPKASILIGFYISKGKLKNGLVFVSTDNFDILIVFKQIASLFCLDIQYWEKITHPSNFIYCTGDKKSIENGFNHIC